MDKIDNYESASYFSAYPAKTADFPDEVAEIGKGLGCGICSRLEGNEFINYFKVGG